MNSDMATPTGINGHNIIITRPTTLVTEVNMSDVNKAVDLTKKPIALDTALSPMLLRIISREPSLSVTILFHGEKSVVMSILIEKICEVAVIHLLTRLIVSKYPVPYHQ